MGGFFVLVMNLTNPHDTCHCCLFMLGGMVIIENVHFLCCHNFFNTHLRKIHRHFESTAIEIPKRGEGWYCGLTS